ncbi:MAG TPA: hypothetical protein VEK57_00340 [Thermoanaerobaculia bacterium]|nr:hypothetical protein [Thermoanaerobaculia bacterium]
MKQNRQDGLENVLRAIRRVSRRPMTDGNTVLRGVHEIQEAFEAALTERDRAILAERHKAADAGSPLVYAADDREEALEDFAFTTAADSLELIVEQIRTINDHKREELYRNCLDIYYALKQCAGTAGEVDRGLRPRFPADVVP